MKIIRNLILVFIASVTLGCTDFLEISNKSAISPEFFPTTMNQMQLLVNSMYGGNADQGLYGFYYLPYAIYLFDKTNDLAWTADPPRNGQLINHTDPTSSYLRNTYREIFRSVGFANSVLDALPIFREKYATESDMSELDFMEGQALFFRAFSYWHGQIFCQLEPAGLALPLMEKVPTTMEEMMKPRATTAEFWQFLIDDLTKAVPLLRGKTDKKFVTEWAAKAFLAKVYAQSGDLEKAKPALKDVIDNSGATLAPFDTYKNMFNGENEFNNETFFEVDLTLYENQWGPWGGATTGSSMPMVFAPRYVDLDNDGQPLASAWGNNFIHDKNLFRFGFNLGVPVLENNPNYNSGSAMTITNLPFKCSDDYIEASRRMRIEKTVDPRLWIGAAQPFIDTVALADGRKTLYHYSDINRDDLHRWCQKKFTNVKGTESDWQLNSGVNYPFIRLADIYLLYAEACATSEPAVALEYVNKVKRRAYGYPINSASPVDYASLTARTNARPEDHLANDPLKYERWAELFAEGQWWMDIRRLRIGSKEAAYYVTTTVGNIEWSDNYSYAQPIPSQELERNENLIQNPL